MYRLELVYGKDRFDHVFNSRFNASEEFANHIEYLQALELKGSARLVRRHDEKVIREEHVGGKDE